MKATDALEKTPTVPKKPLLFAQKQLQKKYKHAKDLGVDGPYNKQNAAKFQRALDDFMDAPTTSTRTGTYRRPAVHLQTQPQDR